MTVRSPAFRVSAVVTSCNSERFLGDQLRSIMVQDRQPDQIVLGDDASDDATLAVAHSALSRFSGDVVVLTGAVRLGLQGNIARCAERATGDVILFADHDDLWRPDKISRLLEAFADSDVDLAFSDARLIDDLGRPTGRTLWAEVGFGAPEQASWTGDPIRVLERRTVVTGATMAARRSLVEAALPVPGTCWHDEWLALAAVIGERTALAIPDTLIDYRVHGGNMAGLPSARPMQRLRQKGWPSERRMSEWAIACERFGPSPAADHLLAAVEFARRRPSVSDAPGRRLRAVGRLAVQGDYWRYGQGMPQLIYDLVRPLLDHAWRPASLRRSHA